jgi:SAM-dependent methyltransferase
MVAALSMVPSVVVSAFAQTHIEGRCVLIFGSAMGSLWEKAIDRGARLVHVCDPDPERLAEASAKNKSSSVSFAPLSSHAPLAIRDGAFDVGIIDNLGAMNDMTTLLRRLRRALSARGVAFITAPNPDVQETLVSQTDTTRQVLDYYSLYDIVRSEFPVVRMLGQMPFVGYTVAELAPLEEPEPKLDAGFVVGGTEEPEWFVAAASAHPIELDGFTVVQLPVADVLQNNAQRQLRDQLRASRHAERSAVERLARLEAQLAQLQTRQAEQRASAELAKQLEELREELLRKERWIASVEARATAADERADEAEVELDRLKQDAALSDRLQARVTQLQTELVELRSVAAAANQSEQLQARLAQAETELNELRTATSAAEQQLDEASKDVSQLESLLQERGERIRQLESELRAVTRTGEQLVRELQHRVHELARPDESLGWANNVVATAPVSIPTDTAQSPDCASAWVSREAASLNPEGAEQSSSTLQGLLEDRARLRADVQAAAWRVEQVGVALRKSADMARQVSNLERQLAAAEGRLQEQEVLLHQLRSLSTC